MIVDPSWKRLYQAGAIAALVAALVFRRNMRAEMTIFFGSAPTNAAGWFTLLHNNSLLSIISLNFFDIIDYVLVGVVFVVLYVALKKTNQSIAAIAASLCLGGIVVYVISDTAFSMFSLSNQYAEATTNAEKSTLLISGQALLAKGVPGAGYQGLGGLISLFLIAMGLLVISAVMLRGKIFNRATSYVGFMAGFFDLAYLVGLAFVPASGFSIFSSLFIGGAGLLLMIWHLLVGVKLYKLSKLPKIKGGVNK